ncbi:hypothetical protein LR48_Vigan07g263100 [Vigna angularis]|uniref:Uncharacterized protein n=1 Tax=Phaseolus angularis TaxID=3914 RepID=A0A0L9V234_PHAAN|nr:hypothetical protein LR48_Vigan07g263100 [Vigna angularis]
MKLLYKEISTVKHFIDCHKCLGMLAWQGSDLTGWASTFETSYSLIGIQQIFAISVLEPKRTKLLKKGDTRHTGESITVHEHVIRMAQALGRAIHVDEVFAQTRVGKGTTEFVDERSWKTHVRSEHGSAPTPDDVSNEDNDIPARGGTLKHQPSSLTIIADEAVEHLTQLLQQRDQENHDLREEYTELRNKFTNFKSLVMKALSEASNIHSTVPPTQPQPSPSPAAPQQPTSVQPTSVQPTSVQPTSVQPIPVQPTPIQPSTE